LISVIIPIYNSEKYLNECISSVLKQTYKDFELILVDDGSTDESLKVCNDFAKIDSRITVVHQVNSGVSIARNRGLEIAKGDFIAFVDSDDFVDNDWLELLVKGIIEKNADVAVCGIKLDDKQKIVESRCETKEQTILRLQECGLLYSVFNKLYRKKFIFSNFKDGQVFGEDLIFNLKYFQNINTVAVISQALYFYRKDNQNSATTGFREDKFENIILLNKQTADFCDSICDKNVREKIQNRFIALHVWDYLGNMQRFIEKGNSTHKKDYKYFQNVLSRVEDRTFFKKGVRALSGIDKKITAYFAYKSFINSLIYFFRIKIFVKNVRVKLKERILKK
jgi:glycosyltransferase involved in cell wall biosynthesis